MTQEEKQLLLTDLSGRIQYGVMLKIGDYTDYKLEGIIINDEKPIKINVVENGQTYKIEVSPDIVKPILRSMSSMTKEEKFYFNDMWNEDFSKAMDGMIDGNDTGVGVSSLEITAASNAIDWLNAHHFDYRGLLEKGLAIPATNEYNTNS